jgi:hypothetical protein
MRRWPALAGLACVLAITQAWADEVSSVPQNSAKPHHTRAKIVKSAALRAASFGDISFSDPYAPPVGSGKLKSAEFPAPERAPPVDPQGGFSITAGRDAPGAPMTGGLKFRF